MSNMRLDLYVNIPCSRKMLKSLCLKEDRIPRFRGIWIENGMVLIHTRSGWWNRWWLHRENRYMQTRKYYLYDNDDKWDCTYANFFYKCPSKIAIATCINNIKNKLK